jgi:hypothetical protein
LAQLDGVTVKLLKSRVPKVSVRDLGFLQDQMSKVEPVFEKCLQCRDRIPNILQSFPDVKTVPRIFNDRDDLLAQLDGVTVKLLKSRVPKVSVRDLGFLQVSKRSRGSSISGNNSLPL